MVAITPFDFPIKWSKLMPGEKKKKKNTEGLYIKKSEPSPCITFLLLIL